MEGLTNLSVLTNTLISGEKSAIFHKKMTQTLIDVKHLLIYLHLVVQKTVVTGGGLPERLRTETGR